MYYIWVMIISHFITVLVNAMQTQICYTYFGFQAEENSLILNNNVPLEIILKAAKRAQHSAFGNAEYISSLFDF